MAGNGRKNGNGNGAKNGNGNGAKTGAKGPRGRRPANGNGNNGGAITRSNRVATTAAPVIVSSTQSRTARNTCVSLSGSDFISQVSLIAGNNITTASDRIILNIPISPSGFTGTRITALSALWERYRFKRFSLRYVPAVPTTVACQVILYMDTDPSDDPTGLLVDDNLFRQATAQIKSEQFNINFGHTTQLAQRLDDQLYYTGASKQNDRFAYQGRAYLIQVTNPLNVNGQELTTNLMAGTIYLDWTVDFSMPQINPGAIPTFSQTVFSTVMMTVSSLGVFSTDGFDPNAVYVVALDAACSSNALVNIQVETQINFLNQTAASTPGYLRYGTGTSNKTVGIPGAFAQSGAAPLCFVYADNTGKITWQQDNAQSTADFPGLYLVFYRVATQQAS